MNSPVFPSPRPGLSGMALGTAPTLVATPLSAVSGMSLTNAVGLPAAAMGGYAGLRVAAHRVPAINKALQQARSQSWRDLLSSAKAPATAARSAATRGTQAATRAFASTASKVAPKLLGRAGLMVAGRVGLAAIPGVGTIAGAALWLFDKDTRKLVNGLISCIHGPGFPPDADAAPHPPRTYFLPLTNDGNRDPQIEKIDQGMTQTARSAFSYPPDKVWPSDPEIATTPEFGDTVTAMSKFGPQASSIADAIRAASNGLTGDSAGSFIERLPQTLGPIAEAFDNYQDAVPPAATTAINGVTTRANELYQKFREINHGNRTEIANSTSGLIPFRANHVNASAMDDSIATAKAAVADIGKHNTALAGAFAKWGTPASVTNPVSPVSEPTPQPSTPAAPQAPAGPTPAPTPVPDMPWNGGGSGEKSEPGNQLGGLPGAIPSLPGGMPGGGMPGGIPSFPSIPSMPPSGMEPTSEHMPLDEPDDEDGGKGKGDEKAPEDKEHKEDPAGGPVQPGVVAGNPAAPGTPAPPPLGADRTVRIGNKDYQLDSPRMAAAIKASMAAAQSGPGIPIPQALAEAGYNPPPVGQPLGIPVDDINVAKPGSVIVSDDGTKNAYYLGNGEAYTEQGEVRPVSEVINPTGPNDGIFAIPEPGTPITDPTSTPVSLDPTAVSTSPPTVNANDVPRVAPTPINEPVPQS